MNNLGFMINMSVIGNCVSFPMVYHESVLSVSNETYNKCTPPHSFERLNGSLMKNVKKKAKTIRSNMIGVV